MASIRTFIAIEVPETIRGKIAELQGQLKKEGGNINWVKPGNMHLTLKFLGNVEESKIDKISAAITEATAGLTHFDIAIKNTGVFPDTKRPRVLWVGIEDASGQLLEVFNRVEQELSGLGFEKERRKFSPHLTLGRVRSPGGIDKPVSKLLATNFDAGQFRAEEIMLMRSDLTPTGAIYTVLKKVKLTQN